MFIAEKNIDIFPLTLSAEYFHQLLHAGGLNHSCPLGQTPRTFSFVEPCKTFACRTSFTFNPVRCVLHRFACVKNPVQAKGQME